MTMTVSVYGSGYVGLVTAALLADVGNQVLAMDIDADKVAALKRGEIPIFEPGLEEIVMRNLSAGRLDFTTDADLAVAHGEFQFIAVGTPSDEDGSADLRQVLAVARSIGERMIERRLVVCKSTVPVGTGDRVAATLRDCLDARGAACDFAVVSNPEFLKEGAAVEDFMKPDRVIVGGDDERAIERMRKLYAPFCRNRDRLLVMQRRSSELTKYAANAMLATKISFMNEIANIAARVGADIEQVRLGIGSDPRIGYHFIYPGCGYGGSCFPKDVRALLATSRQSDYAAELLAAVDAVNQRQKHVLFEQLSERFDGQLSGRTIGVWGLSFKPNTDDMREAPSRVLMEALWAAGARVQAYDPVAMQEARRLYPNEARLTLMGTGLDAARGADALVINTEWREFRVPDWATLRQTLKAPLVFDGRNIYDPVQMGELGIEYHCIGRPVVGAPGAD